MNVNEQDLGTTDVFIDLFGIYTSERLRRTDATVREKRQRTCPFGDKPNC